MACASTPYGCPLNDDRDDAELHDRHRLDVEVAIYHVQRQKGYRGRKAARFARHIVGPCWCEPCVALRLYRGLIVFGSDESDEGGPPCRSKITTGELVYGVIAEAF